jgi:acyl-CoA thioester hydrolase
VSPAHLDDLLKIKTRCVRKKNCSLVFQQAMFNQSEQLLSEALIDVVCVNKQLKPIRLPDALLSKIEQTITMEKNT